jgi:hypothetical protein
MLKSALPYKEAFENLKTEDANFTTCPTDKQWEEVATMCNFLCIFNTG